MQGYFRPGKTQEDFLRAITEGHTLRITSLLRQGAKVNNADEHGNTPLHYAVLANQLKSVIVLVNNKAHCQAENNEGELALELAEKNGYAKIASYLRPHTTLVPPKPCQSLTSYIEIAGWQLQDVPGDGNCFFHALADQIQRNDATLIKDLPQEIPLHTVLRLTIQGEEAMMGQWVDHEDIIQAVLELDCTIAIADSRQETLSFVYHTRDAEGKYQHTAQADALVPTKMMYKLVYTGNHYLSVISHPKLFCETDASPAGESCPSNPREGWGFFSPPCPDESSPLAAPP